MKMRLLIIIGILNINNIFAQTLDQKLREIQNNPPTKIKNITGQSNTIIPNLSIFNKENRFFDKAPEGINSLLVIPDVVEEVKMGYITSYFPRGYGRNNLHFGIWNAIPFIIFNNDTLDLRFGMIFEHRQTGFIPDDWISTTLSGTGLPNISFLISKTKTFLNFAHGTSQWRGTVLFTENEIKQLKLYTEDREIDPNDPYGDLFTVTHRFIDSGTRPYLIGLRHKSYFKIMIELYNFIKKNPQVKTFKGTDAFPSGGFFDELAVKTITEDIEEIQSNEQIITNVPPEETILEEYEYSEGEEYIDDTGEEYYYETE